MIIFFSGTGNSKYIAQMLGDLLEDEVVDTLKYMKDGIAGDFISEKPYIFVAPVYLSAPPEIFMDFFKTANFAGEKKAYFVMTCAGYTSSSDVFFHKLCEEKGLEYMGCEHVTMPQNYLIYFKLDDDHVVTQKMEKVDVKMPEVAKRIQDGEMVDTIKVSGIEYIVTKWVMVLYYKFFTTARKFRATDQCVGCGKCEKECPLNNISVNNKEVKWGKNCTHCMACINGCPTGAIEYGKKTVGLKRFKAPVYKSKS